MSDTIKAMSEAQLRDLIALLVDSATPMSIDKIGREIDAIGAELLRRRTREVREAANA